MGRRPSRDPQLEESGSAASRAAAVLATGGYDYGWFGGRANDLDDHRHVAFPVQGVVVDQDRLTFRFDWKGAVVSGRLYGRSFTGTWHQSTGDGEVALEFSPDFTAAEGWWTWPQGPARHRAFIRLRERSAKSGTDE
ncbi:MAG: hypothetical protein H6Q34_216 [Deltaproteobacteria bacterium]|nr:hypothetical protein [Deltaproteobacteria bacterium]